MDMNNINNNSPTTTYTHLEWTPLPFITVTKILSKINLGTGIGEVVGTAPDRVSEEGVREHDGGGWSLFTPRPGFGLALLLSL